MVGLPEELSARLVETRARRNFQVDQWIDQKTDMLVLALLSFRLLISFLSNLLLYAAACC